MNYIDIKECIAIVGAILLTFLILNLSLTFYFGRKINHLTAIINKLLHESELVKELVEIRRNLFR